MSSVVGKWERAAPLQVQRREVPVTLRFPSQLCSQVSHTPSEVSLPGAGMFQVLGCRSLIPVPGG